MSFDLGGGDDDGTAAVVSSARSDKASRSGAALPAINGKPASSKLVEPGFLLKRVKATAPTGALDAPVSLPSVGPSPLPRAAAAAPAPSRSRAPAPPPAAISPNRIREDPSTIATKYESAQAMVKRLREEALARESRKKAVISYETALVSADLAVLEALRLEKEAEVEREKERARLRRNAQAQARHDEVVARLSALNRGYEPVQPHKYPAARARAWEPMQDRGGMQIVGGSGGGELPIRVPAGARARGEARNALPRGAAGAPPSARVITTAEAPSSLSPVDVPSPARSVGAQPNVTTQAWGGPPSEPVRVEGRSHARVNRGDVIPRTLVPARVGHTQALRYRHAQIRDAQARLAVMQAETAAMLESELRAHEDVKRLTAVYAHGGARDAAVQARVDEADEDGDRAGLHMTARSLREDLEAVVDDDGGKDDIMDDGVDAEQDEQDASLRQHVGDDSQREEEGEQLGSSDMSRPTSQRSNHATDAGTSTSPRVEEAPAAASSVVPALSFPPASTSSTRTHTSGTADTGAITDSISPRRMVVSHHLGFKSSRSRSPRTETGGGGHTARSSAGAAATSPVTVGALMASTSRSDRGSAAAVVISGAAGVSPGGSPAISSPPPSSARAALASAPATEFASEVEDKAATGAHAATAAAPSGLPHASSGHTDAVAEEASTSVSVDTGAAPAASAQQTVVTHGDSGVTSNHRADVDGHHDNAHVKNAAVLSATAGSHAEASAAASATSTGDSPPHVTAPPISSHTDASATASSRASAREGGRVHLRTGPAADGVDDPPTEQEAAVIAESHAASEHDPFAITGRSVSRGATAAAPAVAASARAPGRVMKRAPSSDDALGEERIQRGAHSHDEHVGDVLAAQGAASSAPLLPSRPPPVSDRDEAATRIQAIARGRSTRKRVSLSDSKVASAVTAAPPVSTGTSTAAAPASSAAPARSEQDEAAIRIQAIARGRSTRKRLSSSAGAAAVATSVAPEPAVAAASAHLATTVAVPTAQDEAATRIQAIARGRSTRKRLSLKTDAKASVPTQSHEAAIPATSDAVRDAGIADGSSSRSPAGAPAGEDAAAAVSAARIQAHVRGHQTRKRVAAIKAPPTTASLPTTQAEDPGHAGENTISFDLKARSARMGEDDARELAAVKIQAVARGRVARRRSFHIPSTAPPAPAAAPASARPAKLHEDAAAAKIQAIARGRATRAKAAVPKQRPVARPVRDPTPPMAPFVDSDAVAAATKIQAITRGRQTRKQVAPVSKAAPAPSPPAAPSPAPVDTNAAATRIQAIARGRQARKRVSNGRAAAADRNDRIVAEVLGSSLDDSLASPQVDAPAERDQGFYDSLVAAAAPEQFEDSLAQ